MKTLQEYEQEMQDAGIMNYVINCTGRYTLSTNPTGTCCAYFLRYFPNRCAPQISGINYHLYSDKVDPGMWYWKLSANTLEALLGHVKTLGVHDVVMVNI